MAENAYTDSKLRTFFLAPKGIVGSEKDAQPEIFSWRDGSQSVVRTVFVAGKLQSWTLDRPFLATDITPGEAANS